MITQDEFDYRLVHSFLPLGYFVKDLKKKVGPEWARGVRGAVQMVTEHPRMLEFRTCLKHGSQTDDATAFLSNLSSCSD